MSWTLWVTLICVTYASSAPAQRAPDDSASARLTPTEVPPDQLPAVHRAAGRLQADFERTRRNSLQADPPGPSDPCDERIGRFCYWHRPEDRSAKESRKVAKAREQLITRLIYLSRAAPKDEWIIGEAVQYLLEAGYDSTAIVVARDCKAALWWCQALRGYALHDMQRYPEAETAFDSALANMDRTQRCAWTDISLLLPNGREKDRYEDKRCEDRAEYEKRFWELADPSYVVPGNDRRTEHFSRRVFTTLSQEGDNPYGMRWSDDLTELVLRYGAPISYSTTWPTPSSTTRPTIGHDREPSYRFSAERSDDNVIWMLRDPKARERYSPKYLRKLDDFDAQFAMFKRGDSALIVATYADTNPGHTAIGVTDDRQTTVVRDTSGLARVRLTPSPWRGVVIGVERYSMSDQHLERAREWLEPPATVVGAPALSTLLLYAAEDTAGVSTLADAIRTALPSCNLGVRRKVGIYWEMYPPASPPRDSSASAPADTTADHNTMEISITVARTDGGMWKWLARQLRISKAVAPLTMGWHDVAGSPSGIARSVVLDLSQLEPGRYRLELAAGPDVDHRAVTRRDIILR